MYENLMPAESLGSMSGHRWQTDPRGLVFMLARYKHVAKLLEGMESVLEVGCADGFGSRIVKQHVKRLTAIDSNENFICDAKKNSNPRWPIDFICTDFLERCGGGYNAVYSLDVFEHISDEDKFLAHLRLAAPVCIIGTPSLESQVYASELSKEGHVNCKTGWKLKALMQRRFGNVFLLSMSDETLHTGFSPMANYLLAVGVA